MAKKQKRIDALSVNMPDLFFELIRDRSLYSVLDSLAEACRTRSERFSRELKMPQHGSVRPLIEEEVEFFDDAAQSIKMIRGMLEADWPNNAPFSADGDWSRDQRRKHEAANENLRNLAAIINDSNAPEEERRAAAESLAKDGAETVWVSRETGKPDFRIADIFRNATADLVNPHITEEAKRELAATIQQFVNQ